MRLGIIPAAGKGLRFKELGKQYPKSMLPIDGEPIIISNIAYLFDNGCDEVVIVVNHQSEKIQNMVDIFFPDNESIICVEQKVQDGLSSAVMDALNYKEEYETADTLILLGDLLVTEDISPSYFNENFVSVQEVDDYSRWCMVDINENGVTHFIDKPTTRPTTRYAVSGVYFFKGDSNIYSELQRQLSQETDGEHQFSVSMGGVLEENYIKTVELGIVDFGTLEDYLLNKDLSVCRSFNDIQIGDGKVIKRSDNVSKMIAEYNWFQNMPEDIQPYTARVLTSDIFGNQSYTMEHILSSSLRDIWLYVDNSPQTWENIFNTLFGVLDTMRSYTSTEKPKFIESMYNKTVTRIEQIELPVENILIDRFLTDFGDVVREMPHRESVIHGDFCFSNIMYDLRTDSMKMIDPRGEIFGSHYYDVAKLYHSVLYDYDYIDAELYVVKDNKAIFYNDGKEEAKDVFMDLLEERYTDQEREYISYITASLFISMIPLHDHNETNQQLFYQKFKDIYNIIKR